MLVPPQGPFSRPFAHRVIFEDGDLIPLSEQLISGCDARGTGTDYSNFLAALFDLNFGDVKLTSFQLIVA